MRTSPPVRVSYPQVFTPRAVEQGQTPKFSIVVMIDKKSEEQMTWLKELHAEAQAVFTAKWPNPEKAPRIPLFGHDKSPFKDGDKACNNQGIPLAEKNEEYAGHFILRAASTSKPAVVDRSMAEIMDTATIYGGCFCKVNLNPYSYDTAGNKGVTFGLNGVQFWQDGDSFGGGRPKIDDMFSPASSEDAANYNDNDPFGDSGPAQDSDNPFAA